jgi:hypothetical protein
MMTMPNRSRWLVALSILLVGLVVVIAIAAALAPALLSARIGGEGRSVAGGIIFVRSYLALAIRPNWIALVGAGLMVASGALPLEDAYKAVDLDTITLLLGMMIVVANLRLSSFFAVAIAWVMAHARRPLILLGAVVATSGVFSASLVNDAIWLVLAPLVLELTLALKRRPVPYMLAVAMASNVVVAGVSRQALALSALGWLARPAPKGGGPRSRGGWVGGCEGRRPRAPICEHQNVHAEEAITINGGTAAPRKRVRCPSRRILR